MPAICPIAVFIPVPMTTPTPLPLVTSVPIKAMFVKSPSETWSRESGLACLTAGMDSPVRADSSISKLLVSSNLMSAPIRSPLENFTISPGTRCLDGILTHSLFLLAYTCGLIIPLALEEIFPRGVLDKSRALH